MWRVTAYLSPESAFALTFAYGKGKTIAKSAKTRPIDIKRTKAGRTTGATPFSRNILPAKAECESLSSRRLVGTVAGEKLIQETITVNVFVKEIGGNQA